MAKKARVIDLLAADATATDGLEVATFSRGLKQIGADGKTMKSDGKYKVTKKDKDGNEVETILEAGKPLPTVETALKLLVPKPGKTARESLNAYMKWLAANKPEKSPENFDAQFVVQAITNEVLTQAGQTFGVSTAGNSLKFRPRLRKIRRVEAIDVASKGVKDLAGSDAFQKMSAEDRKAAILAQFADLIK